VKPGVPGASSCAVASRDRIVVSIFGLRVVACGLGLVACQPDDPPHRVRQTVGPEGGVVASHDNVLQIVILGGALSRSVEIEIEPSDAPPPIFGPAYRVRPDVELLLDAEVTYRRVLPSDPEGVAVAAIRGEDYEDGRWSWVPLPRIELDVDNAIVTGIDGELSAFYGLLERSEPGPSTDTDMPGDDETGTTGGDEDTGESTGGHGPLSHALDIQPLWDEHCVTNCHEPGGLNTDVVLTPDRAYTDLLERFPVAATIPYVEPGDPSRSYLIYKLDDRQSEAPGGGGVPMPQGAPLLPLSVRQRIEAWVEQGAPP
jgi:hypothetical protein